MSRSQDERRLWKLNCGPKLRSLDQGRMEVYLTLAMPAVTVIDRQYSKKRDLNR